MRRSFLVSNKNKSVIISSTFLVATFLNAVGYTQFLTYLIHSGFTTIERSWILSIGALTGILLQYGTGFLVDKYKQVKSFMVIIQILSVITMFVTYNFHFNEFWLSLLILALTSSFMGLAKELLESWVFTLDGPYNIFRSFASVGWSIGSIVLAMLITPYGYSIIPVLSLISLIILIPLLLMMDEPTYYHHAQKLTLQDAFTLFKNKNYNKLLISYFFIVLLMNIDSIAVIEFMIQQNISESIVGWKFGLTALAEIPLFLLTGWFFNRYTHVSVLKVSIILLAIKFVSYGFSSQGYQFLLIGFLAGGLYPFINVIQHELSVKFAPDYLKASSQMVMSALVMNIPVIIAPMIVGYLSQLIPLNMVIILCSLIYLIPFFTISTIDYSQEA